MIALCPVNNPCLDDAASLGNISSEAPDVLLFRSFYFKNSIWDGDMDSWWACHGLCTSVISQADADQCSANNAAICEANPPIPPPPPPNVGPPGHVNPSGPVPGAPPAAPARVANAAQTASEACSCGGRSSTVAAGFLWGRNQEDANMRALLICQQKLPTLGCLTPFPSGFCKGYDITTRYVTSDNLDTTIDYVWTVVGALPDGIVMESTPTQAIFTGTPTTGGTFTFELQALDAQGNMLWCNYTVNVMEILP